MIYIEIDNNKLGYETEEQNIIKILQLIEKQITGNLFKTFVIKNKKEEVVGTVRYGQSTLFNANKHSSYNIDEN